MENIVVPGIDVEGALRRLRGNTKLYAKLLGHFLQGAELDGLKAAFESGDAEETTKAAHTMKGVAANLSAVDIHKLVIELEASLKEGGEITDEHRKMFDDITRLYEEARANSAAFLASAT